MNMAVGRADRQNEHGFSSNFHLPRYFVQYVNTATLYRPVYSICPGTHSHSEDNGISENAICLRGPIQRGASSLGVFLYVDVDMMQCRMMIMMSIETAVFAIR